jgi:pimeloyl-ACP methyl ester carboxylesterase
LLANDLDALRALTQNRASNAGGLASMTMGCLVFVGELDPRLPQARQCASVLPNATFFTLPECDHAASSIRSELVIPHLKAFLSQALRTES